MMPERFNEFIKGTCVIIVFAYLLTRQPFKKMDWLGLLFGLAGLVELWVAEERSPYDTYTLIITFVALRFGARIGVTAALIMSLGAPLFLHEQALTRTWLSIFISLCSGLAVRRVDVLRRNSLACFVAIFLAESGTILARSLLHSQREIAFSPELAALKIGMNSVGALFLQMVLVDADTRHRAEDLRLENERGRTRLAESQLAALQARVHPHFLFNILTSIAALCRLDPLKAEKAVVQLGQLMRRSLESTPRNLTSLREELDAVNVYLELETLRLGQRLKVKQAVEPECLEALVPRFSLQTLVENAVIHGAAPNPEATTLSISLRQYKQHALIAVSDDGLGMEVGQLCTARIGERSEGDRSHGLQIASEQLTLLLGKPARLRLFSQPGRGTLAAFAVPLKTEVTS